MTLKATALAAVLLAGAAGLTACATATPYQPNIPGQQTSGGFTESRIEDNRFRVNFAGNSLTSRDTVERYLLYRAAELTVGQGYDWFALVERDTDKKTRTYSTGGYGGYGYGPYGYWRPYWRAYGPAWGGWGGWGGWDPYWGSSGWDTRTVEKFEASAEIVLRKGPKPADDPSAFDAREVMANLGPTIMRPVPAGA